MRQPFDRILSVALATVLAAAPLLRAAPAWAADVATPAATAAELARLQQDLARLQQEVREQRSLILQLMQMHDALLKYVSAAGGGPPPAALTAPASRPASEPARQPVKEAAKTPAEAPPILTGSISGKVHVNGGDLGEAYVYVDGPKVIARGSNVEIKQRGKQFVPAVAVVQVGAHLSFPNEDKVFHNVFSPSPGDAFDLGTVKSGERPNPVVVLKPGTIQVFCNIHSKMRADVLVVPNSHWTRVHPDGTFQLGGVPVGSRRVVLWGPSIKSMTQKVDVPANGTTAAFTTDVSAVAPHANKQGGAYGSYED